MQFNDRIKERRQKLRYTQKELAEKVNVSPQVISNWERGYTDPSPEDIKKLSTILDTTADYLLGLSDEAELTVLESDLQENATKQNKTFNEYVEELIDKNTLETDPRQRGLIKDIMLKAVNLSDGDFKLLVQLIDSLLEKQEKSEE